MKRKVYQSETDSYIEMEIIARVRYIGESFGVEGLTNNKIYDVVAIEGDMIRVVDDSEEDYLYSVITPGDLVEKKLFGKWEIIEDTKDKKLAEIMIKK